MRYVAIGDSFTEGVGDDLPDGSVRGWADLVAQGLAAQGPVRYANLAVRGRLLDPIVTQQLDAALALAPAPTLLTLNGGGNDMMRPGAELSRLVGLTEQAILRCQDAGVRMVLLTGADPTARLPFGRTVHERGVELTDAVAQLAERYRLTFVNVFGDDEIRRPGYWSTDRLHLNAFGHRRVAGLVLRALGHPVEAHVLEAGAGPGGGLLAEVRYYRQHVAPWVYRRLRGRSSGDGRTGKHLDWVSVEGLPVPEPGDRSAR